MWLQDLLSINYKSCRNTHLRLSRDAANVVIGINDCGKSTFLHAIGLLLGSQKFKFNFSNEFGSRTDLSNSPLPENEFAGVFEKLDLPRPEYDGKQSLILGRFVIEEADRAAEKVETYSDVLRWTLERSGENFLWLMTIFDYGTNVGTSYIRTSDMVENDVPLRLLNETQANLQTRVKADNLQPIKKEPGRAGGFTKGELIEAICVGKNLTPIWVVYDKPSFRRDELVYPVYQYLDWNISFAELENIANLAVKSKIEEQLALTKKVADEQATVAQEIVNAELAAFRDALADALPNIDAIKANVRFKVDSKLTDISVNKSNTDGDIHLEAQGDGIKRQIWFALLKWRAMQGGVGNNEHKDYIWCFDEPETHLYPKAQREFFDILKGIAAEEFQIVVSTHSTVFIDRASFSEIRKFELQDAYTNVSTCENVAGVYKALEIRNSDFLFFDKFLVVEGDTEEAIIPHMFELHTGRSLVERGIQLIKLGGKDKRKEHCTIFEGMLKDFSKDHDSVVYLLDNDVRHELTPLEIEKYCEFTVGKQDIEDSIPLEIWQAIVKERLALYGLELSLDDLSKLLEAIPDDQKVQSNQKFYPALKSCLKSKLKDDDRHIVDSALPSKGRELGRILKDHIKETGHIADRIAAAFDKLCAH